MSYLSDTNFLIMIFVLPGLFGFTLIGEGVNKIMSYDPRGWISVLTGGGFMVLILLGYFFLTSNIFR